MAYTKQIFNLEMLVCIKLSDKKLNENMVFETNSYVVRPGANPSIKDVFDYIFGRNKITETGFYTKNMSYDGDNIEPYTKKELETGRYLKMNFIVTEDNLVYFRPYVTLFFSDGTKFTKTFATYEEAKEFAEEKSKVINIKYEIEL